MGAALRHIDEKLNALALVQHHGIENVVSSECDDTRVDEIVDTVKEELVNSTFASGSRLDPPAQCSQDSVASRTAIGDRVVAQRRKDRKATVVQIVPKATAKQDNKQDNEQVLGHN